MVGGLPTNIVAINRRNGSVTKATVQSWAGERMVISAAKLRAGWIG